MPKHSRRFGYFSHVGPIDDASRFSAVRDSRSTRNASPRAVVTSPPRGRSRWGAGTRRPRAASRRARRAPPLPARPAPPAAPSPRRLPRRFAPPAPRRRGFALEFSAPSHHRSASSGSPDAARSFARATGSGAAASFAAALARSDDRHRPFPRGGERASTLEALRAALGAERSPSSRDVDVAAFERAVLSLRPPSRDPRFSGGATNHPGPQTRVERASTRSSEPSPTTLATGASSPRRASSRDATRSWGAAPPTRRGARRKKNL